MYALDNPSTNQDSSDQDDSDMFSTGFLQTFSWYWHSGRGSITKYAPEIVRETLSFQQEASPKNTPPKINMEHKHGALEDDFPLQLG